MKQRLCDTPSRVEYILLTLQLKWFPPRSLCSLNNSEPEAVKRFTRAKDQKTFARFLYLTHMNISAKCTATDSSLGMPPQLHVHTNICSANHISEFSVCRCVDMAKMTYLSSNRMRAFPHHPCLQRLLWKRSNILWAAVFWTKMTSWHQSSEENAQTAAEEHLWMDRTLKLEADGLLQHWVPLLYEKLRLQSSQDQRNQTAEDCKTVVWFWYAMEI